MAQLVEQRIRNAWVAGSSPASGSKRRKRVSTLFFFFLCSLSIGLRTVKGSPKRSWRFGEERVILECLMTPRVILCTKVWRAAESGQWLKTKVDIPCGCLFLFYHLSRTRTVKGPPKRSWRFGEERRLVAANSFVFCVYIHIFYDSMVLFL